MAEGRLERTRRNYDNERLMDHVFYDRLYPWRKPSKYTLEALKHRGVTANVIEGDYDTACDHGDENDMN